MEIFVGVIVLALVLTVYSIYSNIINEKRLIEQLKEEWGQLPEREISSEKYDAIQEFYYENQDDQLDVDDITWNDLDMDRIYSYMNNTQSSIGEEYLYYLLRKLSYNQEELEERNRLIELFQNDGDVRLKLQLLLRKIGNLSSISIYRYINRLDQFTVKSNLPHYLLILSFLASIGIIFIHPPIGGILTLITAVNNIYQYYKRKAEIEHYLIVFAYILRLLDAVKLLDKLNFPSLQPYISKLNHKSNDFTKFKRGSLVLTPKKPSGNLFEMILDYYRMLFHIDLIKFNQMLIIFKENRENINAMFRFIGMVDAYIGVASFRTMLPYYAKPNLQKSQKPFLRGEDLYHPLIKDAVTNSIVQERSALITGSNASGKSTFIKTLALNAILAQTVYTATGKSYESSFFMVYSSMALRDNLFGKESYYIVEIKSLKRIFDRLNDEIPVLCFVDEVLRGTNTLERIAASSRILHSLAINHAMVFAATHDIELTHILEKDFDNYHFQERIEDGQILFDYLIYEGRAVSKNAIKLLGMLGFSQDITQDAEQAAMDFLTSGEWKAINDLDQTVLSSNE